MTELIETIQTLANTVYQTLGGGYNESVYEHALAIEMRQAGIRYQRQSTAEIFYKGERVGDHELDFLVEGELVVELKSTGSITKNQIGQLTAYLMSTKYEQGVLLNFPYPAKPETQFEIVNNKGETKCLALEKTKHT